MEGKLKNVNFRTISKFILWFQFNCWDKKYGFMIDKIRWMRHNLDRNDFYFGKNPYSTGNTHMASIYWKIYYDYLDEVNHHQWIIMKTYPNMHKRTANKCVRVVDALSTLVFTFAWQCGQVTLLDSGPRDGTTEIIQNNSNINEIIPFK